MTIESATYINTLDVTLPADADPLAEADDHMRLIKSALKATFPNVTGAITATHTDLNSAGATNTLAAAAMPKSGGTFTGDVAGTNFNAASGKLKEAGTALIPVGSVILWYGSIVSIPSGWALCDGAVHGGVSTPDLRDRFVVGAGNSYSVSQVGGAASQSVTTATAGGHNHGGSTSSGPSGTTQVQGGTADTTVASSGHTHTIAFEAAHSHTASVATLPPYFALAYIIRVV